MRLRSQPKILTIKLYKDKQKCGRLNKLYSEPMVELDMLTELDRGEGVGVESAPSLTQRNKRLDTERVNLK
jgi:hypothetical protein